MYGNNQDNNTERPDQHIQPFDDRTRADWWMRQCNELMRDFMQLPNDNRLNNVAEIMKQYKKASDSGEFKLPRFG